MYILKEELRKWLPLLLRLKYIPTFTPSRGIQSIYGSVTVGNIKIHCVPTGGATECRANIYSWEARLRISLFSAEEGDLLPWKSWWCACISSHYQKCNALKCHGERFCFTKIQFRNIMWKVLKYMIWTAFANLLFLIVKSHRPLTSYRGTMGVPTAKHMKALKCCPQDFRKPWWSWNLNLHGGSSGLASRRKHQES